MNMVAFIETYRAAVTPADCDLLGHMNVQHYLAAVSNGMFALMIHFGLSPDEIRRRQISFAVVRTEADFHCELRPGDIVVLESTVVRLGGKSVAFRHQLKNAATDETAMTVEFKCVLLDLATRRATALPDDVRVAVARLVPPEV
jgi:acyl-CoA thioester hydrolase